MIGWAWGVSKDVDPDLKWRAKFALAAARHRKLAKDLQSEDPASPLGSLIQEWPETLGFLLAPYQCAAWSPETRFERIAAHLQAIRSIPGLWLKPDEKLVVADLHKFSEGTRIIIDRPRWLSREGHLTVSLFKNDFRAFTLTFSINLNPVPSIFVGSIQGRQDKDILSTYRDLTKDFNGVRPRDLIIEMLRELASKLNIARIDAVADEAKISRHAYYGGASGGLNYNEIWEDRGAVRSSSSSYELPISSKRRELEEVAPKKRSMYRRRYDMLDEISTLVPQDMGEAKRIAFEAS
ncbi:DUF535 family protein [Sphingomonas flavescens]|uniref:DUF535 family protein n=1 Tax=Sphingomonas flavescens TaxID=3132797 RepID=UPI002805AA4F|nr:DUF535 family protein [Sphingomonas limnosediminicola]